jgi:hypothetical protein
MNHHKEPAMHHAATLALATLLAGCAGLPYDPHGLSPEQLKAVAGDNKVMVVCTMTPTPWGNVLQVQIISDTGSIRNGGVTIGDKCLTAVTTQQSPPKTVTTVTTTTPQ